MSADPAAGPRHSGGSMRRVAVLVGIDAYPGSARLKGCVDDAADMAACLSLEQYCFDCREIYDSGATRAALLGALGAECYSSEPGDTLLFYFAGHGQVLGDHGHLVTVDGAMYDPGISLAHLGQMMESAGRNFQHVVTVLDCCHAGGAITWVDSRPLRAGDVERDVRAANESRCVLAACRPEENAYGDESHGYFTRALLDGLLGDAVDFGGAVTIFGLHDYVCRVIPPALQTPVFKGDAAGAVILGTGFEPRAGAPLPSEDLARTLAKAESLVDEYYYLEHVELGTRDRRVSGGAMKCEVALEPLLSWLDQTQRALPDIKRNSRWSELRDLAYASRGRLADIVVGQQTRFGLVRSNLGHGGFGHVWEIDSDGDRRLAFKVFHGNELDDETKVQRFQNGYRAMRRLAHPRIVRVHEMTEAPLGFVMDAVPGENLRRAYLDDADLGSKLRILIDISDTIEFAHGAKVIHRDIKPENIIISYSEDGQRLPYLTDFDLAYHETNRTMTVTAGAVGGVINYAAPEQLFNANSTVARAATVDVFAFARLMFFVLVGHDPSPQDAAKDRVKFVRYLNDAADDRAAEILLKLYEEATSHDPADRPQRMAHVKERLLAAEAFVMAASGTDSIAEEDFCSRFGHSFAGVGRYEADADSVRMRSLSGTLDIVLRNKGLSSKSRNQVNLEAELSVTAQIPIGDLVTGSGSRSAINSRLDKVLKRHQNTTRHSGNTGSYQVFVEVRDVELSVSGLNRIFAIVTDVVAGIEQW